MPGPRLTDIEKGLVMRFFGGDLWSKVNALDRVVAHDFLPGQQIPRPPDGRRLHAFVLVSGEVRTRATFVRATGPEDWYLRPVTEEGQIATVPFDPMLRFTAEVRKAVRALHIPNDLIEDAVARLNGRQRLSLLGNMCSAYWWNILHLQTIRRLRSAPLRILACLETTPALTREEVVDQTGLGRDRVDEHLGQLVRRGTVVRVGDLKYESAATRVLKVLQRLGPDCSIPEGELLRASEVEKKTFDAAMEVLEAEKQIERSGGRCALRVELPPMTQGKILEAAHEEALRRALIASQLASFPTVMDIEGDDGGAAEGEAVHSSKLVEAITEMASAATFRKYANQKSIVASRTSEGMVVVLDGKTWIRALLPGKNGRRDKHCRLRFMANGDTVLARWAIKAKQPLYVESEGNDTIVAEIGREHVANALGKENVRPKEFLGLMARYGSRLSEMMYDAGCLSVASQPERGLLSLAQRVRKESQLPSKGDTMAFTEVPGRRGWFYLPAGLSLGEVLPDLSAMSTTFVFEAVREGEGAFLDEDVETGRYIVKWEALGMSLDLLRDRT